MFGVSMARYKHILCVHAKYLHVQTVEIFKYPTFPFMWILKGTRILLPGSDKIVTQKSQDQIKK
jgi:hypothetical protein